MARPAPGVKCAAALLALGVFGSLSADARTNTLLCTQADSGFGEPLAAAGDVDNDGLCDLLGSCSCADG